MSYLTDIVIISSYEQEAIGYLNDWLAANGQRRGLGMLPGDSAGGTKVMTRTVYAGCFNYLDETGFAEAVRNAPWRIPHAVAVYSDSESGVTEVFSPARDEAYIIDGGPRTPGFRFTGLNPGPPPVQ